MNEYFGIIARSPDGSTAVMELVSGREKAASRIAELVKSDHIVTLLECRQVELELVIANYFKHWR